MSVLRPAAAHALPHDRTGSPELFEQTVPRALVHRAAVAEVLVTGIRPGDQGSHLVGAQWPRGHSYYGAIAGRWHDTVIYAETIRQAGLLLAHRELGVPLGQHFLIDFLSFTILADGALLDTRPADVAMEVSLYQVVRRGARVSSFRCRIDAYRHGERIGVGDTGGRCITPVAYRRLRGEHADAAPPRLVPHPLDPRRVGRHTAGDVVLAAAPAPGTYLLRADGSHPVLFDHPVDHVPGMVVVEAARQAALAEIGCPDGLVLACEADFARFVEFEPPCLVSVTEAARTGDDEHALTVRFDQAGSQVSSCRVTVREGRPR